MTNRPITPPVLGEFELMVLLAVLALGDDAYPLAVGQSIEERTGRPASRASVQITLERLEEKGLLTSYYSDPTPVRGGRARRQFVPKPIALDAVRAAVSRVEAMTAGLESLLKPEV